MVIRKLTSMQVWMIRFGAPGLNNSELSRRYDVSRETIGKIRRGRTWKHITRDFYIHAVPNGGNEMISAELKSRIRGLKHALRLQANRDMPMKLYLRGPILSRMLVEQMLRESDKRIQAGSGGKGDL